MSERILIVNSMSEVRDIAPSLSPAGFDLVFGAAGSAEYRAALPEADYLFGQPGPMDAAFYKSAPRLKLVQLFSAGYDRVDLDAARAAGVPVCNNGGANSMAVAEHTILLMLAVYRRLTWQHSMVSSGRWRGNRDISGMHELHGKTVGIIGLGNIGKRVARIAAGGFGARIQYHDIVRLGEDQEDTTGWRYRLLEELLQTSDIVSLHVPLTTLTRNMISTPQLRLMQKHAILINACRGGVVDLPALHDALVSGQIAGAGLDVFPQEPPSPDEAVLGLDNVVLTAHLAGNSYETRVKMLRNGFDNVLRVSRGERPFWIVPELRDMTLWS